MSVLTKILGKPIPNRDVPGITRAIIIEAKDNPNGYVYAITGNYERDDYTPPGAVIGAWKVDANGEILPNSFIHNPAYRHDLAGRKFSCRQQYDDWLSRDGAEG